MMVIGASTLVGGFFPEKKSTSSDFYQIDNSKLPQNSSTNSVIQLHALKFKKNFESITPILSPSSSPTNPTVIPTAIPVSCTESLTLDLLLDKSGSMDSLTPSGVSKIRRLKEAVLFLSSKLGPNTIIGVQSFNKRDCNVFEKCPYGIKEDIPISYYKDVSSIFSSKINGLVIGGSTPTNDGLVFSLGKLREAQTKFPDRKFKFILISDGQPVPSSQDPYVNNPNPVTEIKNLGIEIYTIAIYDSTQANTPNSPLKRLMQKIASSPGNFYEADTADQLKNLMDDIFKKTCT